MTHLSEQNGQINVALFCGGRGSTTIIQELLRWPDIQLTLIVNAYDDGLSTGALRGFVAEMLGPSDFRKNLSYLLDLHSEGQYALKSLIEYRLPQTVSAQAIADFAAFTHHDDLPLLIEPLRSLFSQLSLTTKTRVRQFLASFFAYAQDIQQSFVYSDCSIGNLIFAGAYLEQDKNFNAAAKELNQLVNSRATLVNVSNGENRILVGLKDNGDLLASEAQIVGQQDATPIRNIFLVKEAITAEQWHSVAHQTVAEKERWLHRLESVPTISPEASAALQTADIIIYGPGTQHSSLLPSYKIASQDIKSSSAAVKVLVMNLEPDHDIQVFTASDIIDRGLLYLDDINNQSRCITHLLRDNANLLAPGRLENAVNYKNILCLTQPLLNNHKAKVHNGRAVVEKTLALWKQSLVSGQEQVSMDIFIDIHKRSLAIDALSEEFLEMDWKSEFSAVNLTINQAPHDLVTVPDYMLIAKTDYAGPFPESHYFFEWLQNGKSEYLVLLTGDGEYRFRDVMLGIQVLKQSHFGALFGSRTQSRRQFKSSVRAAYGENKFYGWLSSISALLMCAVYSLRFGIIFSDPLTGFRIFKRSKLMHLLPSIPTDKWLTPVDIAKRLINHKVEIAELPVNYRTFSGFTDPHWRMRRGFKNLLSLFT